MRILMMLIAVPCPAGVDSCLGASRRITRLAVALLLLAGFGFGARLWGQATPAPGPAPAPTVRLTVLGDNAVAQGDVKAVWGFACLVEARGHTVLFDTGADPGVLKDNLAAMKVAPAKIEAIVISHYHGDHTWGAPGLGKLAGVRVFTPRSFEGHPEEAAALRSAGLTLVPVSQTTPLFEGMTISEPLHFAGRIPFGGPSQGFTDELWEQCLTVDTPDGLVVIVGCSHPGIVPMLEQVKRQTSRPLYFVIGGFHLLDQPEAEVRKTATALQAMGVAYVSATHCTGATAAWTFRDILRDRYVTAGVGAVINLPFATMTTHAAAQTAPKPAAKYGSNSAVGKTFTHNGVQLYYEVYGAGEPVLLVHGNGGSIATLKAQIDHFRAHYQVIAMDSRDQGKSSDSPDKITYEKMTDDLAALLDHLNVGPVHVLGWSDGGIEALLLGIRYPAKVKKIAAMAANLNHSEEALYPEVLALCKTMVEAAAKETPVNKRELKLKQMVLDEPHIGVKALETIAAPTLILASDHDMIREEHTLEIFRHIPNSQLCIFPNSTHMVPYDDPALFNTTVDHFFRTPFVKRDRIQDLVKSYESLLAETK